MLICLRIIIELHKQFRPPISQEVRVEAKLPRKDFVTDIDNGVLNLKTLQLTICFFSVSLC